MDLTLRTAVLLAVTGLTLLGCAEDCAKVEEPAPPTVINTSPADGATNTRLNPLVEVWFDQAIDESTIDTAAFHVEEVRTARLEYNRKERSIRLYMAELLDSSSTYQVLVKSSVSSADGQAMAGDFTFSFKTGPLDCAGTEDYLEPNNSIASAAEIEIVKAYPLLSSCGGGGGEDFFRFTLQDTAGVIARMEQEYSDLMQTGWYYGFRRDDGALYYRLDASMAEEVSALARFTFLPGTYYLETGSLHPEEAVTVYSLIIQVGPPCPDDSLEDNDFLDEAVPVSAEFDGSLYGCFRDNDYFSIRLGNGQTLTAEVGAIPSRPHTRTLEILGPDGTVLTGAEGTDDPATESWTAQQDTTYYLRIMWRSTETEYSLKLDVSD